AFSAGAAINPIRPIAKPETVNAPTFRKSRRENEENREPRGKLMPPDCNYHPPHVKLLHKETTAIELAPARRASEDKPLCRPPIYRRNTSSKNCTPFSAST